MPCLTALTASCSGAGGAQWVELSGCHGSQLSHSLYLSRCRRSMETLQLADRSSILYAQWRDSSRQLPSAGGAGHEQDLPRVRGLSGLLRPLQGAHSVLTLLRCRVSMSSSDCNPRFVRAQGKAVRLCVFWRGRYLSFSTSLPFAAQAIMKRTPVPMTPLESLASSAVRTAHKVRPPTSARLACRFQDHPIQDPSRTSLCTADHASSKYQTRGHLMCRRCTPA